MTSKEEGLDSHAALFSMEQSKPQYLELNTDDSRQIIDNMFKQSSATKITDENRQNLKMVIKEQMGRVMLQDIKNSDIVYLNEYASDIEA